MNEDKPVRPPRKAMRLAWLLVAALAEPWLASGTARAQIAIMERGSVDDLDPPKEAGETRLTRAIITSSAAGRMRAARAYNPEDLLRRVGRPVGRLSIAIDVAGKRELGFCTASLIADDLLLTNNHCIVGNPIGTAADAILWMGYLRPRSSEGVKRYVVDVEPVEASERLDYAIHRVSGHPGADWGTVSIAPDATIRDLQSLFVVHHPGGREQHVSLACATHSPALDGADILHLCDTLPGSSGAPVFDNETHKMVGLHYRAVVPGELNGAKRLAEIAAASPTLKALATPSTPAPLPTPVPVAQQAPAAATNVAAIYALIAGSSDPTVLERFVAAYPGTPEAASARLRLEFLRPAASPAAAPQADEPEEVRAARAAAEAGDTAAMYKLGDMYFSGEGVARDQAEAIRWYQRAARGGQK
ncbi:trypsin-like peptidase domain-containing protein [Acuticoccus kandeliae]|uniref:trypsin-like peptidase domain-containing protein n=1 Tax=Acuticoccus kandeliae TaxID=2073160 RepID=UPI000D3E4A01|nr:trypsin-like peptidase domain-containing protein [Acuticoccus kandeliae]